MYSGDVRVAGWSRFWNFLRHVEKFCVTPGKSFFLFQELFLAGVVHGAFVLSRIAAGSLDSVDPSEALAMPGVVRLAEARVE